MVGHAASLGLHVQIKHHVCAVAEQQLRLNLEVVDDVVLHGVCRRDALDQVLDGENTTLQVCNLVFQLANDAQQLRRVLRNLMGRTALAYRISSCSTREAQ
jgi:hypothetical protein